MARTLLGALLAVLATAAPGPARAEDEDYVRADTLIHSDVPLWGGESTADARRSDKSEDYWPQHFYSDDGSFGCSTVVSTGVWRYVERASPYTGRQDTGLEPAGWYRFGNYGAFHCAMTVAFDYAEDLGDAHLERGELSLFVNLGTVQFDGRTRQLWAIQRGFVPGSEYILLARDPSEQGIIRRFDVLERVCPKADVRSGGSIDSFLTHYCAINTREDLIALARSMAKREPLGQLKWTAAEPANTATDD